MGAEKGVSKKVVIFGKKLERFFGGSAAGAGSLEKNNSSKFAEKACFDVKDCNCVEKSASRSAPPTGGGGFSGSAHAADPYCLFCLSELLAPGPVGPRTYLNGFGARF